jgi:hypothetical protein
VSAQRRLEKAKLTIVTTIPERKSKELCKTERLLLLFSKIDSFYVIEGTLEVTVFSCQPSARPQTCKDTHVLICENLCTQVKYPSSKSLNFFVLQVGDSGHKASQEAVGVDPSAVKSDSR